MKSELCMETRQEDQVSNSCGQVNRIVPGQNGLDKYKPTKHQKAHKVDRNLKKRCYIK